MTNERIAYPVMLQHMLKILAEYNDPITVRQLYYQFVARQILPNNKDAYKKVSRDCTTARELGQVPVDAIEDRNREAVGGDYGFDFDAEEYIGARVEGLKTQYLYYNYPVWVNQPTYIEVWVEKEALSGVAESACSPLDIPFFCCKGYTSQSEMYSAAQRILRYCGREKRPVIIHLGDHDPSGIDMSRDIKDRLDMFTEGEEIIFKRIALNMDQVEEYNPPPNPAKMTDSRFKDYMRAYGDKSWELDALEPKILVSLIKKEVEKYLDYGQWEVIESEQRVGRQVLAKMAKKLR